MKHSVRTATLLVLLPCLVACVPASTGTKSLVLDASRDVLVHEQSGFSFPSSIGRFQRASDTKFYGETGNNFSVPYSLISAEEKVVATIYIYPGLKDYSVTPIPKLGQTPEWFLQKEYDQAKSAIIEAYRARQVSEEPYRISRSLLNPTGKKGVFEWDTVGGETVLSHLYLFAHRGWLVKYRFT